MCFRTVDVVRETDMLIHGKFLNSAMLSNAEHPLERIVYSLDVLFWNAFIVSNSCDSMVDSSVAMNVHATKHQGMALLILRTC